MSGDKLRSHDTGSTDAKKGAGKSKQAYAPMPPIYTSSPRGLPAPYCSSYVLSYSPRWDRPAGLYVDILPPRLSARWWGRLSPPGRGSGPCIWRERRLGRRCHGRGYPPRARRARARPHTGAHAYVEAAAATGMGGERLGQRDKAGKAAREGRASRARGRRDWKAT